LAERMPEEDLVGLIFKDNMESLGLSQKDIQFRNKWRRIKGASGSPGKMAVIKMQCVLLLLLL